MEVWLIGKADFSRTGTIDLVQLTAHPETFLQASSVGAVVQDYRFTYPLKTFINPHHAFLDLTPSNSLLLLTAPGLLDHNRGEIMKGWLWKADALKLYELGYYAEGDVLELGTYAGLSTCILAQAVIDSGRQGRVVPIDIADFGWKANADLNHVSQRIDFQLGPAIEKVQGLIAAGRKFGFLFVDHSHTYAEVAAICPLLDQVTMPGSFVQFHDYNDSRNGCEPNYGVWQAVVDTLPTSFQFYGVYGCSGVYRFTG